MAEDVVVREVRDSDFDAIATLTNEFIRHTAVHFATETVTAAELRQLWLTERATYPFLVMTVDGTFAGFAKAFQWRVRAAYQWTTETSIYLDDAYRGRGLGRVLYEALLGELRTRGFHSAIGCVTLPNDASVRLHESVGFVATGTVEQAGWKFGQWYDVGFWQALLHEPEHEPGT